MLFHRTCQNLCLDYSMGYDGFIFGLLGILILTGILSDVSNGDG